MIELQRDVMTLQDQVRQMNEKLVALTTMLQTALDNTKQSNVSILAHAGPVNESLQEAAGQRDGARRSRSGRSWIRCRRISARVRENVSRHELADE